ncbi:MAG: LCP family protein, partial [Dehalococcoidia bacterium]
EGRRSDASARVRPRSGRRRFALASALIVLAICALYASLSLFSRVYPALFPGQTLAGTIGLAKVVAPLPGLSSVNELNESSAFNNRINLLVLGLDKRPQNVTVEGHRADLIIVASMDPVEKKTRFLSVPRDLWVEIHLSDDDPYDYYKDRINSSFQVGFLRGGIRGGAEQVQRDLLANFGISTDQWIVLDFTGVELLVDAVGGIDLDIPYELSVPNWWYSDDDVHAHWVSFPAGPQHLDGYNAVAFGRYREDSDLRRIKRQQIVAEAGIARLFSIGLLADPVALWDAYSETVTTDLSKARMLGLVPLFRQTQGQTEMYSLGDPVNGIETVTGFTSGDGKDVLAWDRDNVRYWLDKTFPKVKYVGSSVEIRDASGDEEGAKAAALARYLLFYRNLPSVSLGPEVTLEESSRIELHGDREALAEDLMQWLGLPPERLVVQERTPGLHEPDVVIVIGSDFVLPNN